MENNKFINKTENKNNSKEKNENYLLPQIVEIKGRNINKDNENQLQLLINNQEKKRNSFNIYNRNRYNK